jgi:uncharacterized protein YaiE (UPF0345 family)
MSKLVVGEIEDAAGGNPYSITISAEQATTSGTSIDFTSIPAGVKQITVCFAGVSTSGTSVPQIQLGDTDGVETSGYLCVARRLTATANYTAGFAIGQNEAGAVIHGALTLFLQDSSNNHWVGYGITGNSASAVSTYFGGAKPLSAELDRVRITTVNGSDTFDAGAASIQFQ